MTNKHPLLWIEFFALFLAIPLLLFFVADRTDIYGAIWLGAGYSIYILRRSDSFSWEKLWNGSGWQLSDKKRALLIFFLISAFLGALTVILFSELLFAFPLQRFALWLAVMVLYPLLSVIPQSLIFRSFFFERYAPLFKKNTLVILSGLAFGFSHIVLNNWIAPTFCALGGILLAHNYHQHRSLKWAAIEHSLYGCWVFTVGLGWYFFTGNWR